MRTLFLLLSFFIVGQCWAQDPIADEESFDERYKRNIKKSRINGVYIPKDLEEAMSELVALSSEESITKFKGGEESLVAKRLHFSLGRWMIYNWNFYEGSRFSHHLKSQGLNHPDDQARFVIVSLHRKLNGKEIKAKDQIQAFQAAREKERLAKLKVIKEETRVRQNEH